MPSYLSTLFFHFYLLLLLLLLPVQTLEPPLDPLYFKYACRGAQLHGAMSLPLPLPSRFLLPVIQPWDGDLRAEFTLWGYTEAPRDPLCDFQDFWHLQFPFDVYGHDARPASRGGPNVCISVLHGDPWKRREDGSFWPVQEQFYEVEGRRYQSTSAFATIGINAPSGILFFLACKSPTQAARELWKNPYPDPNALPALRQLSDIAWGLWNRAMGPKGEIGKINALWVLGVVNRETNAVINIAHRTWDRGGRGIPGWTLLWPGVDFPVESLEAQAILGSPSGLAVGFFLTQHKKQFGCSKMVHTITVFRTDTEDIHPNLIFWVRDGPSGMDGTGGSQDVLNSVEEMLKTVGRNFSAEMLGSKKKHYVDGTAGDGRNFGREHILNGVG